MLNQSPGLLCRTKIRFAANGWCLAQALCLALIAAAVPSIAADTRLKIEVKLEDDDLRSNVEAHLSILAASEESGKGQTPELTENAIHRLHKGATGEIEEALQPYGFYAPVISAALTRDDKSWKATYAIDPGPLTRLRKVTIGIEGEGQDLPELLRLIEQAELVAGQPLNHPAYDKLKAALRSEAYSRGFLDSNYLQSRIEVHPDQQVADLMLVLDTGPRYYFGAISIEQDALFQTFIDKFVRIRSGDIFEPQRLTELQLALTDSPYFNQAAVSIQRDQAQDQHVPVRIKPRLSNATRYETSVGYGTDTGPRGGAGVLWRRINQHGHQFRTDVRLSAIQSTLASQYKIPIGAVSNEYLDFTADAATRRINDVEATSYAVGSSLNQSRWGGRRRGSIALRREVWNFGDLPSEGATLLVPGLEYSRIVADDLLFTRSGYSFELSLGGAVEQVLSDTSFLQARFSGRYVTELGEQGRLLLRGEYGATATDDFNRLPPSLRFFNGGAQSVRGYGFEELSPRDDQGNLIGGSYLGTASVEVDYLLRGNFGLALFVDTGNASNSADIDWKTGVGIGLRYKTPVGMFRLDFAYPLDDPDSSFAFHISFGPDLQ